jgi:hypothetical protein
MLDGTGRESRHRQHRPVNGGRDRAIAATEREPHNLFALHQREYEDELQICGMRSRSAWPFVLIVLVGLACAACGGGGPSHKGRTVTFITAGNFPPLKIVGTYSVRGCAHDTRTVAQDAALYYAHSTGLPGPADLYYYDLRFAYAHFQADGCASSELGQRMKRRLTARQRTFLLHNVASNLQQAFRAALGDR